MYMVMFAGASPPVVASAIFAFSLCLSKLSWKLKTQESSPQRMPAREALRKLRDRLTRRAADMVERWRRRHSHARLCLLPRARHRIYSTGRGQNRRLRYWPNHTDLRAQGRRHITGLRRSAVPTLRRHRSSGEPDQIRQSWLRRGTCSFLEENQNIGFTFTT